MQKQPFPQFKQHDEKFKTSLEPKPSAQTVKKLYRFMSAIEHHWYPRWRPRRCVGPLRRETWTVSEGELNRTLQKPHQSKNVILR